MKATQCVHPLFLLLAFVLFATISASLLSLPRVATAQVQTTTVLSERDRALLAMIQQLQEMIVVLQRKLTTIHGQKEGENLINENSIAQTNESINLYSEPNYSSKVVAKESKGNWGEVSAGPKLVNGEVWWKFDFQDGASGWSPESKLTRTPSTVMMIDEDLDGIQDARFRFIGEYDPEGFVVEPSGNDTIIRYEGRVVKPYDIVEL